MMNGTKIDKMVGTIATVHGWSCWLSFEFAEYFQSEPREEHCYWTNRCMMKLHLAERLIMFLLQNLGSDQAVCTLTWVRVSTLGCNRVRVGLGLIGSGKQADWAICKTCNLQEIGTCNSTKNCGISHRLFTMLFNLFATCDKVASTCDEVLPSTLYTYSKTSVRKSSIVV